MTVAPPALAVLADVPPRLDSPYLFHSARGRRLSKGSLSYAFRVVRQRWGKRDKLELYELRHACATLLMERGLPPHVVANQLGHTDGGALVQRLYGHPSEHGVQMGSSGATKRVEMAGFRALCNPPSPLQLQSQIRRVLATLQIPRLIETAPARPGPPDATG